jgi:PAS domain S-box-containing protein
VEPRRDHDGAIVQWYGVSLDIDDEMRAKEAQRDRERELAQFIDMVPVSIVRMAPNGEPTFFSKRTRDLLGLDVVDLDVPGMTRLAAAMGAAVHPDDLAPMREKLDHSLATGEPYSIKYRHRLADGTYRWMHGRAEPLRDRAGAIVHWYAAAIDIEDEVRAQQALRDREQELQQLVDMVPSYLWRLTPKGEPNFYNKRFNEFLGVETANAHKPGISRLAAVIAAAVHPDDAPLLAHELSRSLETGERFSMRYRLRRADGVYRWMDGRAEPLRDQGGRIVQWYGLANDVDDQLRAEEVLRRSERQLQQLIDAVPINIWSFTPAGKMSYISKRYLDHLGVPNASLEDVETIVRALVHPEDAAETQRIASHGFQTGTAFVLRYRRREKDGTYRWCEGRAEPLRDRNGAVLHWYAVSIDIDDEKRAQEALRQVLEKLEQAARAASLAELSASIAHEVNQPLAAIIANSQACQRWLSIEPPNIQRAKITTERIVRDANSAADVVSRVRALFRQAPHARSSEDINRLISEVCRLMAGAIAAQDIRLDTYLEPDLPSIALDRVQVQQVLVNLVRNGIEAMDGVIDRPRALQVRSCRDGVAAIRVEVRDFGTGIKDAERVFEPFFTTKQQGMGMGLAICRSIVEAHGGRLWMANKEPCGALATFTLPLGASEPMEGDSFTGEQQFRDRPQS